MHTLSTAIKCIEAHNQLCNLKAGKITRTEALELIRQVRLKWGEL